MAYVDRRQYKKQARQNWLTANFAQMNKQLGAQLASSGNANGEEMKASALALKSAWRKVLSVKGGARIATRNGRKRAVSGTGTTSRPGEAPRQQTGALRDSVAQGVAGAGRRVAVLRYTALMLEQGVDTSKPARPTGIGTKSWWKGKEVGRRRRAKRVRTGLGLKIAPRPSAQRALDLAQGKMVDVFVEIATDRIIEALE